MTTVKLSTLKPNATAGDRKIIKAEASRRTFKAPRKRQPSLYLCRWSSNVVNKRIDYLIEAHLEKEAALLFQQKFKLTGGVFQVINLTPIARASKLVLITKRKLG